MRYLSINQTQVFYSYSSIYFFDDFCNTLGVCHLLSTRFELKHDKFNGNKEVKVNL